MLEENTHRQEEEEKKAKKAKKKKGWGLQRLYSVWAAIHNTEL